MRHIGADDRRGNVHVGDSEVSTYREAFCNITTDLQAIEPNLESFDQKRRLAGVSGTVTDGTPADVYSYHNTGHVDLLYRDGVDLGAAQASAAAVDGNVDGEWYYDAATDRLYLASTANPDTTHLVEAGRDWVVLKTEAVNFASEMVRALAGKPILPLTGTGVQGEAARDYEAVIVDCTASLAVARIIRPYDFERAAQIASTVTNPDNTGWLDKIRRGDVSLHNESSPTQNAGDVVIENQHASSTGTILDLYGKATVHSDLVRVKIITGGTFGKGSSSAVTYSVWVGDTTGLANTQVVTAAVITGGYQELAHGLLLRFGPGLYTADDAWQIAVRGDLPETGTGWGSYQATRL